MATITIDNMSTEQVLKLTERIMAVPWKSGGMSTCEIAKHAGFNVEYVRAIVNDVSESFVCRYEELFGEIDWDLFDRLNDERIEKERSQRQEACVCEQASATRATTRGVQMRRNGKLDWSQLPECPQPGQDGDGQVPG